MKRREALKNATYILGFTISAGTVAAVLKGCQVDSSPDWEGQYLTPDQILLLDDVSEMIIPRTETPGARDAQVVRFIDAVLACNNEAQRNRFLTGLAQFDSMAQDKYTKTYLQCADEQKKSILDQMVIEARSPEFKGKHIFYQIREKTVVGFCVSEIGAKSFLRYDAVPGGHFNGCIDYDEVGGSWAL
jgi:hypothetical protein